MKSGKVAKLFGKDSGTILDWTERFGDFFSASARGDDRRQRDYTPEDLIILNTVRIARDRENASWEEIRARLENGDYETALPAEALAIPGESAMTVYANLKMLETQLEQRDRDIERLFDELHTERDENKQLREEVGKWRALATYFEEQLKGKDDE